MTSIFRREEIENCKYSNSYFFIIVDTIQTNTIKSINHHISSSIFEIRMIRFVVKYFFVLKLFQFLFITNSF